MKKELIIFLITIVLPLSLLAQTETKAPQFWRIYSAYGELKVNGFYRNQLRKGNQIDEKQQSSLYSAGVLLRTKSYIWNPKFMVIDVDGEYTPDKGNEKFLAIPDQAENRDMRKFDARLTFLPQNKFSIGSYFNYGRVYNNRENLSSIKSAGTNWGSTLYYHTKKVPFSIGYTSWNQDESEVQTGRRFLNRQNNLEARANTSFGKLDRHEFLTSYSVFYRKDYSKTEISNKIKSVNYNGFEFFGAKKRNSMSTLLSGTWQNGYETFTRYQAMENINAELAKKLHWGTNYMYMNDQRYAQFFKQHKIGTNFRHQLFESLQSQIGYEYNTTDQSLYKEWLQRGSADISYTKKLFKKHNLDLAYRYELQHQKWNSQDGLINVINETINLKDGQITLLSRPYITLTSIRIKDITGTIIYQENLDYQIITQNNFVQIQRIPGGLIPNNTTVYIDYTALQPGNYQYQSTNNQYSAGLYFFNRLFGVYYRKSVQDYNNLKKADFLTLNYYTQEVMGARVDYKYLSGGAEYDNMNSTILPYQLYRYYLNIQGTVSKRMILSANSNLYDYKILNNVKNIRFIDLSGSATYHFRPLISLAASVNYRKQNGEGVDLDLFGFRTEFVANIQKLRFSVLYNYYNRNISTEKIQFNAVNVQLARKF